MNVSRYGADSWAMYLRYLLRTRSSISVSDVHVLCLQTGDAN